MSIKNSLKGLLESMGGTSTAKNIPGVIGEISAVLGGESTGKSIAEQIDNITAKKWADNPLSQLAADADIGGSVDLLGKVVGDLQEDIEIEGDKITGTSKYVTGYTGFSGDPSEQEGNYLALHFGVPDLVIGTSVTIKVNDVSLDPDGLYVIIFKKKTGGKLVVTAEKDGYATFTRTYDLSGVVRAPEEEETDDK